MSDAEQTPDHSSELAALVGRSAGPPVLAPLAVNQAMIGHWAEAMGDNNPVYTSAGAAAEAGYGGDGVVAPATMLQTWTMPGLSATLARDAARAQGRPAADTTTEAMMALLDDEGLTAVVATNCDQTYARPLVVGDRLVASSVIEAISDPKDTALGTGRFVTTRTEFRAVEVAEGTEPDPAELAGAGEPVATMSFRIYKYRPKAAAAPAEAAAPPARRPRPAVTEDIAFWFEGAREHRLLIQRCLGCQELRHPPLPACPRCRSFEWDAVEASGRGEVYSFVVIHHPHVPGFEYPLPIGLIELEEGTRLVADLGGVEPDDITVGMQVQARFVDFDEELSLPVFHPVAPSGS